MKKLKLILVFAITVMTFVACSSVVEVQDEWKNDNFKTLQGEKILVVNKTSNSVARQRFEQDVANELRALGIDATESTKAFPNLGHKADRTEAEMTEIVKMILDAGYKGVVLTVLKDKNQQIETTTTGGYNTGGYYPSYYGGYYRGFGSYYGGVYGHGYGGYYGGTYVPQETTSRTVDVYLVETVTYNLELAPEQQLVGVVSVKVTDPESFSEVADKYSKIIAKQFEQ